MRLALTPAQTLEFLAIAQHLAPLLGQRGHLPRALVSWQSPLVLTIFWHSRKPWASAQKRLMRSLHAGSSSMHERRRAKREPVLAPPGGERWSSRSAHVKRRCTFIKRALVRTVGGAK